MVWASVAGTLFAGYMSGIKLFSGTCAFSEACPTFLGYPSCYFGFLLFLLLAAASFVYRYRALYARHALTVVRTASFLGVLFAGYFTLGELPLLFSQGSSAYMLGLPTCALGFIFFVFILGVSLLPVLSMRTDAQIK